MDIMDSILPTIAHTSILIMDHMDHGGSMDLVVDMRVLNSELLEDELVMLVSWPTMTVYDSTMLLMDGCSMSLDETDISGLIHTVEVHKNSS